MSDNKKVYHKVLKPLKQALKGKNQHHISVLALMITGLVQGKSAQLSKLASEAPTKAKNQSTFRRFQRWVSNERVQVETYYLPFISSILSALSRSTLYIAMDASSVGRGCQVLMFGVVYKKRLLPLCWHVYRGIKGHAPAQLHIQGLQKLAQLVPNHSKTVLIADGEYDSIDVLRHVKNTTNWGFAIRTSKTNKVDLIKDGKLVELGIAEALGLEEDELGWIEKTYITKKKYGPVMVVGLWESEYKEGIYLVTNLESADVAVKAYKKRFVIETLFSDQKGRGFQIDKSHIDQPERLSRLLLAVSLAYIWMIYFGVLVLKDKQWDKIDHSRQDKSLFRLGLDWLKYLLIQELSFRAIFHLRGVM